MKTQVLAVLSLCVAGCSGIDNRYQTHQTDQVRVEAERLGNSGPLYDHYVSCVEDHWRRALDDGSEDESAYQTGLQQCTYQLSVLCDFYGVVTCLHDAKKSNRVLFSLLLEDYRLEHVGR